MIKKYMQIFLELKIQSQGYTNYKYAIIQEHTYSNGVKQTQLVIIAYNTQIDIILYTMSKSWKGHLHEKTNGRI